MEVDGITQKFYMFLTFNDIFVQIEVMFSSFVHLPTAVAWNLSGFAFMWLSANHLISNRLSSTKVFNKFW